MLVHCSASCLKVMKKEKELKTQLSKIGSVYDLVASDINGKSVDFREAFAGKVVIVVNVASECGYTNSHYAGFVDLHKDISKADGIDPTLFEIVAFPCNQFGGQEPGTPEEILRFATDVKGANFLKMMGKVDVNGPEMSLVYAYLKDKAGVEAITWNFATYFVIDTEGNVNSYTGVEPKDLKSTILHLLKKATAAKNKVGGSTGKSEEL